MSAIISGFLVILPQNLGGGGVLPYKGLMGQAASQGMFFRDFCLKQGTDFINFCLKQGIFSWTINSLIILTIISDFCLTKGIKNRNSVLNKVGKSAIFVLRQGPKDISSTPPPPHPAGLKIKGVHFNSNVRKVKSKKWNMLLT